MRRRITMGWGPALAAALAAAGAAPARADGPDAGASPTPTYHKDVARLLQKHCQDCHRPGQVAPFALLTYDQARKRAADLAHVTGERQMPPWPASTAEGGPFKDARVLDDAEIATLAAWAEAGCPEGDLADGPEPRTFTSDWPLGEPDLLLTVPEPYELGPEGDDDFRVFVLRTDLPEDRWIKAVDFRPGNRRVVHHIIAGVDASGRGRELDAADPGPGYFALGGFGDGVPLRGFLPIWTPGAMPRATPEGSGYLLPKGADILIQVHYHRSGKPEVDATEVGLYLSAEPLPRQVRTGFVFPDVSIAQAMAARAKLEQARAEGRRVRTDDLLRDVLVIPPGEAEYRIQGSTRQGAGVLGRPLQRDILLTAVMPHMHWLGREFTFTAVLPDGETRIPLIRIDRWDFNWQGTYAFETPVPLPKGTWFEMEARFDNSEANPSNQSSPPKEVRWGEGTDDEMCIGIFEFVDAEAPAAPKPKPDASE